MDFNDTIITDIDTLTKPSEAFDFSNPPFPPSEFAHHIVNVMFRHKGLGLAAVQLGYHYRIFAISTPEINYVCFNPRIVMPSAEQIKLDEGCLSFPNLFIKVTRPRHVKVRFSGPDGEVRTLTFKDMDARAFQHELEHCDGKLFFESCTRFRLERALKGTRYEGMGLLKYAKGDNK